MNNSAIFYPAFGMFCLTMGCIFALGIGRYRAIHGRQVRISFYRTYDEGSQPERLHLMSRHVQNHFEVPPMFYVGVLFAFVLNLVNLPALVFSWLFLIARCVHSFIHLGSNNVSQRFFTFGFSLLALCGLWFNSFFMLIKSPV